MVVALYYANHLVELGEAEVYNDFFKVVCDDIFINRLYKNFIKENEIDATVEAFKKRKEHLNCFNEQIANFLIDKIEKAKKFSELIKRYTPIRIVIFDEPFCTISDNIPLEDYDNNDGEPFWMRPKYILEHYSKSNRK